MGQLNRDYVLDLRILNALDQGVPQDRERVFMIGFRRVWLKRELGLRVPRGVNDALLRMNFHKSSRQYSLPGINGTHWFPWPVDQRYQDAKKRYEWPKPVPFGTEPPKPLGIPDELMVSAYICNLEEISHLPNGLEGFEPKSNKFSQIPEGDDSRKSFKRLHRWRYSPAAAYGNNEVHLHPLKPRRLTVREALRIQTVPDEYALPTQMPLSHKFKTIGNGVPVKLSAAVASSINKVLKGDFDGNF
jgi:DNA (cytosine-5)-methyltransferase 1